MEVWIILLSFIAGWVGFAIWAYRSRKWSKTIAVGGGFIVGCLVFGITGGILLSNIKSKEPAAPIKQIRESEQENSENKLNNQTINTKSRHFNFTSKQYISRYNESLSALEQSMRLRKKEETVNDDNILIQAFINKYLGLIIQVNKSDGFVNYITFIGTGDGSLKSGLDLIMALSSVIMAIENPNMSPNERGEIIKDLGITDKQFPNDGEELKFIRNGVKYKLSKSKEIGIWLMVEPI